MDRRRFLVTSLAGALATPLAVEAQQPALPLVAVVEGQFHGGDIVPPPLQDALLVGRVMIAGVDRNQRSSHDDVRDALRDAGYIDGRDVRFTSSFPGNEKSLKQILSKLIQSGVRVIVTIGTPATLAAKVSTKTVPIVMVGVGDPVGLGIVRSLRQPGGNITGTSFLAPEIVTKGLELLRELKPTTTHVAVLRNPANPAAEQAVMHMEEIARQFGLTLHRVPAPLATLPGVSAYGGPIADFRPVFAMVKQSRSDGLIVVNDPMFFTGITDLADFAIKDGIPTVFQGKHYVQNGGLIAYLPNPAELFRAAAMLVVKILKGARPGDLPVEQPTKFELVINLKTAKALGLTIPPSLLLRADQVIE